MDRKVLWWKPWLSDTALHKMADLEIAAQLTKRNYIVHLIVPTINGKIIPSTPSPKMRIHSIQMKFLPIISPFTRSFFISFILPIYILTLKPDFVVTEPDVSILGFFPTSILCKLLKIKIVLDIRSVPVETFGIEGFMINLWFSVSLMVGKKLFDGITAITSLMKDELCDKFQIDKDKIGVWTSGVSTDLFDPSKYSSEALIYKNKLGLSSKFVVFYHGKFSPTRGLKQTIKAMKILKIIHPKIFLFLLGSGPITSDLNRLIKAESLEDTVAIHGPVDQKQVPLFISMCNAGIVPLPNNQFWRCQSPLKLLEYLAMEKAIIATDIPAHRTVLYENSCVIYFSSIEPIDIAKAIEFAYLNEKKLANCGKGGRKIIQENYSWEKVATDLDSYLRSLL